LDSNDDIAIWSTGDTLTDILSLEERTEIGNYLDNGGKVYMTGSSIAYDSISSPSWDDWLSQYFNVTYISFSDKSSISGIADPYNGIYNMSLIDANEIDNINRTNGGVNCLKFDTGDYAGVRTNKTMFHSLNFASIASEINRTLILNRTLEYLDPSNIKNILVVDDGTSDSAEKIIQALGNLEYYPNSDSIDVELFSQKSSLKKVFNLHFDEIPDKNIWYNTGLIPINPKYLSLSLTNIKIGLQSTSSVVYSGSDPSPEVWIDNFHLFLKTKALPSQINITANNITIENKGEFGKGIFIQTNNFVYNSTTGNIEVFFNWYPFNNITTDAEISFDCDLNLFINKSTQLTPTVNTINNANNSWTLTPYIQVPSKYKNHFFNFSKPIDWNITEVYEPINSTNNLRGLCQFGNLYDNKFQVNTNILTNFPDGYWTIKAISINYIINTSSQILNGNKWENNLIFYPGNTSHIIATIRNLTNEIPKNVENYKVNLTITDPNNEIWFFNSTNPKNDGVCIFPNITISGLNSTIGVYKYEVNWMGSNEAGYIEGNFTILHKLKIIPNYPQDLSKYNIIYKKFGDLTYLEIILNDNDSNKPVLDADVQCNWTSSSHMPVIKKLNSLGGGYYGINLETSDLPFEGVHTIIINATHKNYINSTYIFQVDARTTYIYVTQPNFIIPIGDQINITAIFNDSMGNSILGANLTYSEPTIGTGNLKELNSGMYYFTINSSKLSIGSYYINLYGTKYGIVSTQALLTIRKIDTKIEYPTAISIETLNNFTLEININDTDHNIPVSGVFVSYVLQSLNGNLTDLSLYGRPGHYNTSITASISPRVVPYDLILDFSKENYSFSSIIIPVTIQNVPTYIYSLKPYFEVPFKDLINITVSYNFSDGRPILGATLSYYEISIGTNNLTELGNGFYYFTLNSSFLEIGTYYIVISSNNFGFVSTNIVLKIIPIQINITSPNSLVQYSGSTIELEIWLKEKVSDKPIINANVSYFFLGREGFFLEDKSYPGRYYIHIQFNIPPRSQPYSIVIYIEKENYSTQTLSIPLTIIEKTIATPWYIQWGWLLGISAALIAVFAGYKFEQKLKSRNWERKIKRLYIIHAHDGVAIYDRALTKIQMDSQLVSAALMGIRGMVKELTSSQKKLKTIDHMDKKIIFEYGDQVIGAILAEADLPIIRKKLKEFIFLFETKYQAQLLAWTGDINIFTNIDKLTNTIFPFSSIVSHREPLVEKHVPLVLNKELLKILNSINDGLKSFDLIATYCDLEIEKVKLDITFLIDNGFIDNYNDLNLTETGIKAIYHSQDSYNKNDQNNDLQNSEKPIEIKIEEPTTKIKIKTPPPSLVKIDKQNDCPELQTDKNDKIQFDKIRGGSPRIPKKPKNLLKKEKKTEKSQDNNKK